MLKQAGASSVWALVGGESLPIRQERNV